MKRIAKGKAYFIITFITLIMSMSILSGCGNKQIIDTTYSYKYAIIETGAGVIQGDVESWTDYEDGDQIQVKIDGTTYLVHSSKITLMTKKPN